MIRFLADENFNGKIVRGLRIQNPDVDIVRVQDTEISGADDRAVLEWAAQAGRILLTHDLDTMTYYANERLAKDCHSRA
jgi:predicted nuclease of predicted toxin-antitoxin system